MLTPILSFLMLAWSTSGILLSDANINKSYKFEANTYLSEPDIIYLQTDRDIYSWGELIFFKIVLTDADKNAKTEEVVYVDLIGPNAEIISQRIIKINNGNGTGDFSLGIAKKGTYLIRAYTSYMRNFSDENYFRKKIYISDYGAQLDTEVQDSDASGTDNTNFYLDILSEKNEYNRGETIKLGIDLYNSAGNAIPSELMISVSDHTYVEPNQEENIASFFAKNSKHLQGEYPNNDNKVYPHETSLSLSGVVSKRGKPDATLKAKGMITSLDQDFYVETFETDRDGKFKVNDVEIYGEVPLIIQAAKGKLRNNKSEKLSISGNQNISIQIDEQHTIAPISEIDSTMLMRPANFAFNSQLQNPDLMAVSTMESWDEGMIAAIDEVTISAPKIDEIIAYYEPSMLYEQPDQRINTDKVENLHQYFDIYAILAGEASGMELTRPEFLGAKKAIILRGYKSAMDRGATGMTNGARFMLNGAFASHSLIESIPPQNIAFIDVIKSLSKLTVYGELGVNGVIIVYLKPPGTGLQKGKEDESVMHYAFKGFHKSKSFDQLVEESKVTPKKTIYWNPKVLINESGEYEFSIQAPNQAGTYVVSVEGLSNEGEPIYGEHKITIK